MLGDFSCRIALQLLGYLYPAYKTYKVVCLPATRSNDTLLRHWCQYWTLMACFTAAAPILDAFLFWVPLYYEAKLAAAVYLWANDLAGAQHVWGRWFQPLLSSYEPLLDRRLAESKALAKDWLHSNSMRLLALAQAKVLAWLAGVQAQAQQVAAGGGGAPPRRQPAIVDLVDEEEEDEAEEQEEVVVATRGGRRAAAKRSSIRGGKGVEPAVPDLETRRSSFSLHTFFSARSSDLQAQDVKAGLKAFPLLATRESPSPDH